VQKQKSITEVEYKKLLPIYLEKVTYITDLCNNAKSNLIDENSWFSLFVSPMREYYKKLLGRDLEYDLPVFDRTDNKTLD